MITIKNWLVDYGSLLQCYCPLINRYRSLREDDFDHAARQEEAEKRAQMGSEIGFNYDNNSQQHHQQQQQKQREPINVRTLANCIEKTAEFILTQGNYSGKKNS